MMKKELKKHFENIEQKFLDAVKPYVPNYKAEIEIVDVAERQRKRFKDLADKFSPCFSLVISMTEKNLGRKLEFTLTDGKNLSGEVHYNTPHFYIGSLEKEKRANFNLRDYFTYKGMDRKIDNYIVVTDYAAAAKEIDRFLAQVVSVLEMEEIQSILSTKKWIYVPIDMSDYK